MTPPKPSNRQTRPGQQQEGLVVRNLGNYYEVQVGSEIVRATIRGKLRLENTPSTNPIAVGDRVLVRIDKDGALILEIRPRANRLVRRAAGRRVGVEHIIVSNVDFAWAVQSTLLPKLNPRFVDRFLVMAEFQGISAGLILNKWDLITDTIREPVEYWRDLYLRLGYPVLATSAKTGFGVGECRSRLVEKTTVFAGPSGAGKTSLINAVDPALDLKTGEVSSKTRKGRHITTSATLHALSDGGCIIDTPGLREFGVVDVPAEELGHYFVEFRPLLDECHFPNCTHDHEPGCAVVDAVESGSVTEERWVSYLNILSSLRQGPADVGR